MPDEKTKPLPKQKFVSSLTIRTPHDADKTHTEAAVRKWLEKQLKDCPFGELKLGDVIDMIDKS